MAQSETQTRNGTVSRDNVRGIQNLRVERSTPRKPSAEPEDDTAALSAHPQSKRDAERLIQKVQRSARNTRTDLPEEYDQTERAGKIQEDFEKEKSVAARARKPRKEREAMGGEGDSEQAGQLPRSAAHSLIGNRMARMQSSLARSPKLSAFSKGMGYSTLGWAFFWQFVCALISALGYGLHLMSLDSTIVKIVSWFINIEAFLPGQYVFWIGWVVSSLIVIGSFIVLLLWYLSTNRDVFGSDLSIFIAAMCFACSLLPFINVIPWLLFWMFYNDAQAIRSTVTSLK